MFGNDCIIDDDAQAGVVDLNESGTVGILRWHRVAIGVEGNLAELVDVRRTHNARARKWSRQSPQRSVFTCEAGRDRFVVDAMHAHLIRFAKCR